MTWVTHLRNIGASVNPELLIAQGIAEEIEIALKESPWIQYKVSVHPHAMVQIDFHQKGSADSEKVFEGMTFLDTMAIFIHDGEASVTRHVANPNENKGDIAFVLADPVFPQNLVEYVKSVMKDLR